ncbi:hypothetical protein Hanom_Chr07g00679041 [Helianthus anomalus]
MFLLFLFNKELQHQSMNGSTNKGPDFDHSRTCLTHIKNTLFNTTVFDHHHAKSVSKTMNNLIVSKILTFFVSNMTNLQDFGPISSSFLQICFTSGRREGDGEQQANASCTNLIIISSLTRLDPPLSSLRTSGWYKSDIR